MQINKLCDSSSDEIFRQIAILHERLLSAGVLATLGHNFLIKLYQSLANSPGSAVYVVQENDKVLGFVACTVNTNFFYKQFLYKNLGLMCSIIPKLCTVTLLKRSFSLLKYVTGKPVIGIPTAELLSIAVIEDAHRLGIGGKLMSKVLDFMRENKVERYKVTAAQTQKSAHKFYQSKGGVSSQSIELGKLKSQIYYFKVD